MDNLAEYFKVFSEPSRLAVLDALRDGPRNVTAVVERTGLSQALVSKHLKLLAIAGVVQRRPEGSLVFYEVIDKGVFKLLAQGESCCWPPAANSSMPWRRSSDGGGAASLVEPRAALAAACGSCPARGWRRAMPTTWTSPTASWRAATSSRRLCGADLSGVREEGSFWHEADLSGARSGKPRRHRLEGQSRSACAAATSFCRWCSGKGLAAQPAKAQDRVRRIGCGRGSDSLAQEHGIG